MPDSQEKNSHSSAVVAKAGLWYTVCNFLFKGMAFITTPIFTRLMTKSEIGYFSNLSSWLSILLVLTSFDLSQSIIRSKLEHEDDMDSYIWSILSLGSLATLLVYGVVLLFPDFFVELFQVDMKYIHIMFLYLLVSPAYQMLITKHRAFFKYKSFVAMTGVTLISATVLSFVMVLLMQDRLAGRILGHYLPYILIGGTIYVHLALKGKKIKVQYWKYACVICLPLVPHVLSLHLLNSSDKILLTQFYGTEVTAIYSIAYSCYHIATILFDSLNKAWAPWLLESLHNEKYSEIQKVSKIYIGVFACLIYGLLLLVPEIIYILGGEGYSAAIYCLPPLITSCMFQLVYTMYVNIEFYKKKTVGVAIATIVASAVNFILDYFLLPVFPEQCHIVAAYTTMIGFMLLFVFHYYLVKRMGLAFVYDIKFILCILCLTIVVSTLMNFLYSLTFVRYAIVLLYATLLLAVVYRHKEMVLKLFGKRRA